MFPSILLGPPAHQQPAWSLLWEAEDALPKYKGTRFRISPFKSCIATLQVHPYYPPAQHLPAIAWKAIILQPNTDAFHCDGNPQLLVYPRVIGNEREDPDPGLDTKVHPVPGE